MKLEHIKIGQKLKVVGNKGGCNGQKCKDCHPFSKNGILVFKIEKSKGIHGCDGKFDNFNGDGTQNWCTFFPEDLEPFYTSWKERYGGKK